MTSLELPERPEEAEVQPLDIVGHRERGHLSHLGLALGSGTLSYDNEIEVADARPVRRGHERLPVHLVGRVPLDRRQRLLAQTWLERQARARSLAGDYINRDDLARDAVSGRVIARRRSSAAFIHAYLGECAGVELVDLGALPPCERGRLMDIWGERAVQSAVFRGELPGQGPWALLLPGHIFHALAADAHEPGASPLRASEDHWDVPKAPR